MSQSERVLKTVIRIYTQLKPEKFGLENWIWLSLVRRFIYTNVAENIAQNSSVGDKGAPKKINTYTHTHTNVKPTSQKYIQQHIHLNQADARPLNTIPAEAVATTAPTKQQQQQEQWQQ